MIASWLSRAGSDHPRGGIAALPTAFGSSHLEGEDEVVKLSETPHRRTLATISPNPQNERNFARAGDEKSDEVRAKAIESSRVERRQDPTV